MKVSPMTKLFFLQMYATNSNFHGTSGLVVTFFDAFVTNYINPASKMGNKIVDDFIRNIMCRSQD